MQKKNVYKLKNFIIKMEQRILLVFNIYWSGLNQFPLWWPFGWIVGGPWRD